MVLLRSFVGIIVACLRWSTEVDLGRFMLPVLEADFHFHQEEDTTN